MANWDYREPLQEGQDWENLAAVEREYRQAEGDFNDALQGRKTIF